VHYKNPTLPLPESGSDTEALESYALNHERRWAERETTTLKDEEIKNVQENVELFDAFFEKIRAVPFPEQAQAAFQDIQVNLTPEPSTPLER
jgi:hypothetical protein